MAATAAQGLPRGSPGALGPECPADRMMVLACGHGGASPGILNVTAEILDCIVLP